ncbi:class I SAM-dependent methyltransferase [Entomomonas moraniae]|uniref:Class I SAM-dependent methyltransferase n=1 Tax=Entomomonas moraniae TaxID=2213226 RepID=A0A3S9XEF2_9GAMM|nr:class I SAM-dependent methyltransferase [Entomomonas moraniae]
MNVVLDVCCGSRMFYFDKQDQRVLFGDQRKESHTLCDGRALEINPDVLLDFRNLQFNDNSFSVVVFDPPHLVRAGDKSWLALKYGKLGQNWQEDIKKGFAECFRVLKPNGVLIFKWNEIQIPVKEILSLTDNKPVFGHKSGKRSDTHWMTFIKEAREGYSFIKQEELANLVNERNCYRYGLKHGFSLEEVEKAIKEARA